MPDLPEWRRYLAPLNLAAYAALLAVAIALSQRPPSFFGAVGDLRTHATWSALLGLFLLGFLTTTVWSRGLRPLDLAGFLTMIGTTLILATLDATNTVSVLLVITASVLTTRVSPLASFSTLVLVNLLLLAIIARRAGLRDAALIVAIYGGFQAFAAFASHAFRRANEIAAELRETNAWLLATRTLLTESARDGERLRLSRELHDVAGHKLTALRINLSLLARDAGIAARPEMATASALAQELLGELRSVVSQLRRHDGIDLRAALQRLAEVIPTPRVIVEAEPDVRIEDAERADGVLRIAQEALTNALRHARSAREIHIRLGRAGDALRLDVENDGHDAASTTLAEGHGISGMKERAIALGGRLEVGPSPGGRGFHVRLIVPRERPP